MHPEVVETPSLLQVYGQFRHFAVQETFVGMPKQMGVSMISLRVSLSIVHEYAYGKTVSSHHVNMSAHFFLVLFTNSGMQKVKYRLFDPVVFL